MKNGRTLNEARIEVWIFQHLEDLVYEHTFVGTVLQIMKTRKGQSGAEKWEPAAADVVRRGRGNRYLDMGFVDALEQ
ncbi:uncharacterized protein N7498_010356 [Penicillium cinerascens]|uniref:Uncharacterized protein n=1 Tax=Penicillium cinerascens TaxID=70096 RepID=A0A9W9JBQ5_9EURO|nr:uncharacterized protein N7498_010356 [Penicillium cinerascens]KAJ5191371.1 hypothetical protein N7498_010356 [Penicillium cinerascens]